MPDIAVAIVIFILFVYVGMENVWVILLAIVEMLIWLIFPMVVIMWLLVILYVILM